MVLALAMFNVFLALIYPYCKESLPLIFMMAFVSYLVNSPSLMSKVKSVFDLVSKLCFDV